MSPVLSRWLRRVRLFGWFRATPPEGRRREAPAPRVAVKRRRPGLGLEHLEGRVTPTVSFLAVGSGDATSSDAILWTRAQDSASTAGVPLMAQVSTSNSFASGLATFAGVSDATQDYTIHLDATGLQAGTTYFYRFVASDGTVSQVGTFKTAPSPATGSALHFGFTGDADGLLRPYDATGTFTSGVPSFDQQNFNYFVWLGDTIYETASGTAGNNNSPATSDPFANPTKAEQDYWRKYREQFLPVSTGPYPGLSSFFSSTEHETLLDNHELGNKQFINGGAPAGSPAGAGVDATNPANDVNTTGTYINKTPGFQALVQAYSDYQPIRFQTVNAPNDPRSNGTQQLYYAQQESANSIFLNLDDRSYRDIRMKTASGADDTGVRADNPGRTMLGATQLQWFEQQLLAAQAAGTTWKFVAVSSPIDQIGPAGGQFTISNGASGSAAYTNTESDGGKSWMGGYRAERNALLKFIADNKIDHVVFLSTDDHQVRINELGYFTAFNANGTPVQSSYTRVPGAFEIVVGPIGATGPDGVTDHSFANIQALANSFSSQQVALGIDPIGLDANFPGLTNVFREGDPNANTNRSAVDFYSPDTYNYATLDLDPSGQNLTITIDGLNSYATNTFPQPNAANPVRKILSFTINAGPTKISGKVFGDANANGNADGSEVGLAGVTVFLDANGNGVRDPGENSAVSDANGNFTLLATTPGKGVLTVDPSASSGYLFTQSVGARTVAYTTQPVALNLGAVPVSSPAPFSAVFTDQFGPRPNSDPTTATVRGFYRTLLGRDGDAGGVSYWVGQIQSGMTAAQVSQSFVNSAEHRGAEVDSYYRTYLNRASDAASRAFWVSQFQAGASEEQVAQSFLNSTEYAALHAGNDAFVDALYLNVLGRSDSASEHAGAVAGLNAGVSRSALAQGLVLSDESRLRAVDSYYAVYLHRAGDAAGRQGWLALLKLGTLNGSPFTLSALATNFTASAEFSGNAARAVP